MMWSTGSLTLEQRKRKILANLQRNRATKTWVRLTRERSMRRKIIPDQIEESSGDEECDPIQTETGYRCHLCPFVTKKVSRLERHVSGIHAHDVTYRCSECGYTCKWNRDYFLHMKSHYDGPPYKCQCCKWFIGQFGMIFKSSYPEFCDYFYIFRRVPVHEDRVTHCPQNGSSGSETVSVLWLWLQVPE